MAVVTLCGSINLGTKVTWAALSQSHLGTYRYPYGSRPVPEPHEATFLYALGDALDPIHGVWWEVYLISESGQHLP